LQKQEEMVKAIHESNSRDIRQIVEEVTDEKLQLSFSKLKSKDGAKIRTFTSIDKYTMQVAHLHTLAY